MNALKVCPFCGNTPAIVYETSPHDVYSEDYSFWRIECKPCELMMSGGYDELKDYAELIERWNNRIGIIERS